MPVTYMKGGEDFQTRVMRIMEKYHGTLKAACVTVDVLLASNDDVDAVTLHGVKCYAKVRKLSLKDRAAGRADAEIVIDADMWPKIPEESKDAIIDHELQHLEFTGKRDDLDRPKLAIVPHDFEVGWFASVAQRHGGASIEVMQAEQVIDTQGQSFFPFIKTSDMPGLRMAQ